MTSPTSSLRNAGRRPPRRGVASLEFVMALPLLLILVTCIITGGYVAKNRLAVSLAVRRDAWKYRHGPPPPRSLDLPVVSTLGVLAGVATDSGLVLREMSRSLRLPSVLSRATHTATFRHAVMGGAWDDQSIPFGPKAPLQPDPRWAVYSPGVVLDPLPFF
jgi:hypothetical protein